MKTAMLCLALVLAGLAAQSAGPAVAAAHEVGCDGLQVIAHRGYHHGEGVHIHENTAQAFTAAAAKGYDVETDIRPDSEGVLWVMHDPDVFRDTGVHGLIAQMTTAEVRALRTRATGQPIPTLAEALAAVHGAASSVRLYLEVKVPETTAGVAQAIRDADMVGRTYVTSYTPRMHRTEPDIRLLFKTYVTLPDPASLHSRGVSIVALLQPQISAAVVASYHHDGIEVQIGRANAVGTWRSVLDDDIDGVLTDEPDALAQYCGAAPPPKATTVSPAIGAPGDVVAITGSGLASTGHVEFANVSAAFTVDSENRLFAVVPEGAPASSKVTVTTPAGSAVAVTPFKIPPRVAGIAPVQGAVGSTVVVDGTGLGQATVVRFGAVDATFTVASDNEIVATVPVGAPARPKVRVTTVGGSVLSDQAFTVTQP